MTLVVIGSSGHGRVVADAARRAGHAVIGFIDDFTQGGQVDGLPRLGGCERLPELLAAHPGLGAAVAIGDNYRRLQVAQKARALAPGLAFPAIVHPAAVIADSVGLGQGVVVLAAAVANPGAKLGDFALVNTGAIVEHDVELGAGACLSPGAIAAGGVRLGEGAAVMMGALVRQGCHIGEHALIGMGAVVIRDLPAYTVAWGNPARPQRTRRCDEPYF